MTERVEFEPFWNQFMSARVGDTLYVHRNSSLWSDSYRADRVEAESQFTLVKSDGQLLQCEHYTYEDFMTAMIRGDI